VGGQLSISTSGLRGGGAAGSEPRLVRVLFLSLALHVAAFALLALWGGRQGRLPRPETIISVDLKALELPSPVSAPAPRTSAPKPPVRAVAISESVTMPPPSSPPPRPATPSPPVPVAPLGEAPARTQPAVPAELSVPKSAPAPAVVSREVPRGQEAVTLPGREVPQSARSVHRSDTRTAYQAAVRKLIENHKEYPLMARKARLEGGCLVRCTVARSGKVQRVELVKSAGHVPLDRAALRAVEGAGRFPPVPTELPGDELILDIPIIFSLVSQ